MHLLALGIPRQSSANTYSAPFLVKAYVEFKAAEAKFKALKEQLTKHIAPGKHTSKYGIVNKIKAIRT